MKEKNAIKFKTWREKNPKKWQPLQTIEGRLCRTCGERKSDDQFHKDKRSKDGLAWKCKPCAAIVHAKWRAENQDHHKGVARAQAARRRKQNPERAAAIDKKSRLKSKYGITLETAIEMLKTQGGKCPICHRPLVFGAHKKDPANPQIDHCHATNKVRSVLCFACNVGLGAFSDNQVTLAAAIQYLRRHQAG